MADYEALLTELLDLPRVKGVVPVDILGLPLPLGPVIRGLVRDKTISAGELAEALEITADEAIVLANTLAEKGYLLVVEDDDIDDLVYRIHFARMPKQNIPDDF